MASAALYDLLPDFGARPQRAAKAAFAHDEPQAQPAPQQPDVDALVARAVAEAEAALAAKLSAEHAAALQAERDAHAEKTATLMANLGTDAGKRIADGIEAMQAHVLDLVGTDVARILGGLVGEDLRERSLAALARAIREATGDGEAVRISIRGPASLYDGLQASLGAFAADLHFEEAPGFDLTVAIDDAVFETRLSEWSAALSQVLT